MRKSEQKKPKKKKNFFNFKCKIDESKANQKNPQILYAFQIKFSIYVNLTGKKSGSIQQHTLYHLELILLEHI